MYQVISSHMKDEHFILVSSDCVNEHATISCMNNLMLCCNKVMKNFSYSSKRIITKNFLNVKDLCLLRIWEVRFILVNQMFVLFNKPVQKTIHRLPVQHFALFLYQNVFLNVSVYKLFYVSLSYIY